MINEIFLDGLSDSTSKLFAEINQASQELIMDFKQNKSLKVHFLHLGAIVYCKSNGTKHYGVVINSSELISVGDNQTPQTFELQDFLKSHDAKALWVACFKQMPLGAISIARAAKQAKTNRYSNSDGFIGDCLEPIESVTVESAIEERLGKFEWLKYKFPKK